MKILGTIGVLGILAAGTAMAGESVDETRSVEPTAQVDIENISGSVTVKGWDQAQVKITGMLGDDVRELKITGDERRLLIEVDVPESRGMRRRDIDSDLDVWVPRGSRLSVETVSADIEVSEFSGTATMESVSGEVDFSGKPKQVDVETVSGNIEVSGSQTEISAESVSGSVLLRGVVRSIDVETVSGDIEVQAGEIDTADFESISGSITFRGTLTPRAEVDVEAHSGNVELWLGAVAAASFEISTFSGGITNDFGGEAQRTDRYAPGQHLEFSTGSDGAEISVETFSGNVILHK
jgi:DUF4097 and DUF4098 domain-containing protein YvlB